MKLTLEINTIRNVQQVANHTPCDEWLADQLRKVADQLEEKTFNQTTSYHILNEEGHNVGEWTISQVNIKII